MRQYTSVKGVTDVLRMPRLGKIHLGVKANNGMKEYPKETDYFVCPDEVKAIYGDQPKALDIIFPTDSEAAVFPQAYKLYQGPSLRCKGDGETALRVAGYLGGQRDSVKGDIPADPNAMVEIPCPCPLLSKDGNGRSKCNLVGMLSFMIPTVSIAGVYQIDMRGTNSILNINSALALARKLAGTISMIPFVLHRVPQQIQYKDKTSTHYILRLEHQLTLNQVKQMRGGNFMLGVDPAIPGADHTVEMPLPSAPPADTVEDVNPGDFGIQSMSIYVKDILYSEQTGDMNHRICGRENKDEVSPEVTFITQDAKIVQEAFKIAKERCCADIKYRVALNGDFVVASIEAGIPF